MSPEALLARLDGPMDPAPRSQPITGFTILVAEPPAGARRFRLDFLPSGGKLPSSGALAR
jgi:hypothetical protein